MKEYIPNASNSTQSSEPSEPTKAYGISPLMIIMYFLTLSLIGISSYFIFQNLDLKKQITSTENKALEALDSSESSLITSSSKLSKYIYSDNDTGTFYSIEYPNYFEIKQDIFQEIDYVTFRYAKNPHQTGFDVDFTISVEEFEGDLKSFLENKYSQKLNTFTEPITQIKVGDLEGYYFVFNREGSIKVIYLPINEHTSLVVAYLISGDGKLNTLSDEMLRSITVE